MFRPPYLAAPLSKLTGLGLDKIYWDSMRVRSVVGQLPSVGLCVERGSRDV